MHNPWDQCAPATFGAVTENTGHNFVLLLAVQAEHYYGKSLPRKRVCVKTNAQQDQGASE